MKMTNATAFSFPARSRLAEFERAANHARTAEIQAALSDAIARGHADGLARGREEAAAEARELLDKSRREGLERGHADGVGEMTAAAAALREALDAFQLERTRMTAEAEAFCVDLALAMVARMVEADSVRTDFVRRSVQTALKALAPETPTAIFLSPSDFKCVGAAMNDLPLHEDAALAPGSSRVEGGRLLMESSIAEAFAQVRSAVLDAKIKRTKSRTAAEKRDAV